MYITVIKSKGKNKTYQSVLLRESYREGGRVKNLTIANLSRCRPEEIEAIRLALKHKDDLSGLEQVQPVLEVGEGPSLGALWTVYALAGRLGLSAFVTVTAEDRRLKVEVDEEYLAEIAELDGCYALKTDLPSEAAGAETIHDRYKDLGLVEQAFRTCKTEHLKVRPVFVRTEANTRGHVLVVMLAYLIVRELRRCWSEMDVTVEEGLKRLTTLCAMTLSWPAQGNQVQKIPTPREESARLLEAAGVRLPKALPSRNIRVVTRKKLPAHR